MNIKNKIDVMRNTYIRKDTNFRLSLMKGRHDPQPKSVSVGFSVKMNLVQALFAGVGIIGVGMVLYRCYTNKIRAKIIKELLEQKKNEKNMYLYRT